MERFSVFVRESELDPNWVQHFALLPRVPRIGEFIRGEGEDGSELPWYRVERVLHIPPDDIPNEEDETWSAMIFAVRKDTLTIYPRPQPKEPKQDRPRTVTSLPTTVSIPPLSRWSSYSLAAATVLLAIILNGVLLRFLDTYACFLPFIVSVAIVTVLRGWKPGAFCAWLATIAVLFFFIEPICSFSIARSEDVYLLGGFSLVIFTACLATYGARRLAVREANP